MAKRKPKPRRRVSRGRKRLSTRKKSRRLATRRKVSRKPRRQYATVQPWPLHWPIPPGAVPGTVALYVSSRLVKVRVSKGKYRRRRVLDEAWYLIPEPEDLWVSSHEFLVGIENEKTFAGHEVTLREMQVYHTNIDRDVVNLRTKFVWREPRHPTGLRPRRGVNPWQIVRIWFWVRRSRTQEMSESGKYEYQVWCRTARKGDMTFADLRAEAVALYHHVVKEVPHLKGPSAEGFYVDGFIAWTGYTFGMKAPTKPRTMRRQR